MLVPESRQDRFRSLVKTFLDGDYKGSNLNLLLYPGELVRFKKEFPELNFDVTDTIKTEHSKKYKVTVTKL